MDVKDPMPNAKAPVIVTKVEKHKDIVFLDVSCFVCIYMYLHSDSLFDVSCLYYACNYHDN